MLVALGLQEPDVVGIDISSTTVKLLSLRKKGDAYQVVGFAVVPQEEEGMLGKDLGDPEKVGNVIKAALKKGGFSEKHAAISVPGASCVLKNIVLPKGLSDAELQTHIRLETEKEIPYDIDNVYFDFCPAELDSTGNDEQAFLVAVTPKEVVDQRVAAVEHAGLKPRYVDVESFTLERIFPMLEISEASFEKEVVALIDIGAASTLINFMRDGKALFYREQLIGGKTLTEEIQQRYDLSFEEAGRMKKEGGLPEDYESTVLKEFIDSLVEEIETGFQFFYSSTEFSQVHRIVLAGATIHTPGVQESIKASLGVPIELADPLKNMSFARSIDEERIQQDKHSLLMSVGLALRGFEK